MCDVRMYGSPLPLAAPLISIVIKTHYRSSMFHVSHPQNSNRYKNVTEHRRKMSLRISVKTTRIEYLI